MRRLKSALITLAIGIIALLLVGLASKITNISFETLLLFVSFWMVVDMKTKELKK